ncbi:MAG: response regulator [Anaerolineales bacterium]|nr:response regulator [Anaerolineales bacterium]MCB9433037.1 response regulator [Ardenticatenaceae bacterium]
MTILVVDDEPLLRRLLRSMLERGGFQVDEAQDGLDALAKIQTKVPDLLIVDYMMPKMDGPDTCRAVRCHEQAAHVPVIMLSARTDDRSAQHSLDAGATLCLQKPLGFRDLVGSVERLLQHREFASAALAISAD